MVSFPAPVRQLLNSLVAHNKIVTTESQAKILKREAERLISRSKRLDLTARRRALALFSEKESSAKFLEQIVPQFRERVGGYVRVVKLPSRRGDRAPLARVEFVEKIEEAKAAKPVSPPVKAEKPVKEEAQNVKDATKRKQRS
uniref:50S ribosomal protein L17 n=1 Tax=candidate division WWE3 bacterium TaxID=2053526 RepID=A0A832E0T6_UNCKA